MEVRSRFAVGLALELGKRDRPPAVDLDVGLCSRLAQLKRVALAASDPQVSLRSDDGIGERAEPLAEPFGMERSVALVDERVDTELLRRVTVVVRFVVAVVVVLAMSVIVTVVVRLCLALGAFVSINVCAVSVVGRECLFPPGGVTRLVLIESARSEDSLRIDGTLGRSDDVDSRMSRWDLDDSWLLDVEAALGQLLRFSRRVRTATTVASVVSATAPAAAISCAGETCWTVPFTIGSTGKRVWCGVPTIGTK